MRSVILTRTLLGSSSFKGLARVYIFIVKRVNFPRGPTKMNNRNMGFSKIGKCRFSRGFLVKTWKDFCYPIIKLAGKVTDCKIS